MRTGSKRSVLTFVFDHTGIERFRAVLCGNMRKSSREIRVFMIIYRADTRSFSPGIFLVKNQTPPTSTFSEEPSASH